MRGLIALTSEAAESEDQFKDYCLILQVHPEADAGMVEAAYWHLARRYNEQADTDPLAMAHLDDLNEAYSVLGTPSKRAGYFQVRNAVLGIGTLPSAPIPEPERPPLAVMAKQRPQSRANEPAKPSRKFDLRIVRFVEPSWQNTLLVLITLTLATSMLAISANLALVLALLALSMLISSAPLVRNVLRSSFVASLLNEPDSSDQPDAFSRPKR